MTVTESQWWFSPSKIADNFSDLLLGATRYYPNSEPIKKAASVSIHMRGVYVKESYDKDGRFSKKPGTTNDLLVVSNFQTGTAPTVQRVHYFKQKQKVNEWIGNFFNTLVCSFTDFQDNHVTLQTQVSDVDSYDKLKEIVSGLTSMAGNVAVTFPVIAPYVAAGGMGDRFDPIIPPKAMLAI